MSPSAGDGGRWEPESLIYGPMPTILDDIVSYKREFVAECRRRIPPEALPERPSGSPPPGAFARAIGDSGRIAVIAEIKKASPSKGRIRPDFDPVAIARAYESGGASALSVLTDERFFQGSASALREVRRAVGLPILRKDFTIDAYQIREARSLGADAVLLIVGILPAGQLSDHLGLADELGLDALVEVHAEAELDAAMAAGARIIGINNRDLRTFVTDLSVTERLIARIPEEVLAVSESGIRTRADVVRLERSGADAILVGESLMREPDVGAKLRELRGDG